MNYSLETYLQALEGITDDDLGQIPEELIQRCPYLKKRLALLKQQE